jgi:hypothetical protein
MSIMLKLSFRTERFRSANKPDHGCLICTIGWNIFCDKKLGVVYKKNKHAWMQRGMFGKVKDVIASSFL